ncbi:MAG: ATP-binding cassette domain-containing protein, partial [Methylococcaceae bacterium]
MSEPVISVRNLTMAYGDFVIQHNLSFTVNRGDIFIVMGGSGCGKSTLLMHLIGLQSPAQGDVFYGQQNFWQANPAERAKIMRRIGVLFQSGALL